MIESMKETLAGFDLSTARSISACDAEKIGEISPSLILPLVNYFGNLKCPPRSSFDDGIFSTSYSNPCIAGFLTSLVKSFQARSILEIGTQHGRSAVALARGLEADGYLHSFDLFESRYPIYPNGATHASREIAETNFNRAYIDGDIKATMEVSRGDYRVALRYCYSGFDVLHLDICNHAESVAPPLFSLAPFVKTLIILEGGPKNHWMEVDGFDSFLPLLMIPPLSKFWKPVVFRFTDKNCITLMVRKL